MTRGRGQGVRVGLLALLCAGVALALSGPAFGQAACEPVMPTSDIAVGMTGTGWTVSRGRTREPFSVEVLGVLKDGVG
ncbi:MAG: hypothetical protein H0U90_08700, partial [Actinobacteria bacterium]|nr:hypothetical protein [Actinomycetota bacterium]